MKFNCFCLNVFRPTCCCLPSSINVAYFNNENDDNDDDDDDDVDDTAKTCPPMTLPEHAYFVQGQCSNEINAACGIRCKTGYRLQGSSLRLCTEDGVWTGADVTCHGQFQLPLSF